MLRKLSLLVSEVRFFSIVSLAVLEDYIYFTEGNPLEKSSCYS